MTRRKSILVLVILCTLTVLVHAAGGGEPAAQPLKIRALYGSHIPTKATPPTDQALLNYVRQKAEADRGVSIEWIILPPDTDRVQYLQMNIAANTLPEVMQWPYLMRDDVAMKFIVSKGTLYEMNADVLRKYMPNYVSRVEGNGIRLQDYLAATVWQADNRNWFLNEGNPTGAFPEIVKKEPRLKGGVAVEWRAVLRDDILKTLYPNARTAKELEQLYAQKGSLTIDDVTADIPIRTMDDLYAYCKKVKALNLKVGDNPVWPLNLSQYAERPDSLRWWLALFSPYAWRWPLCWANPIENSFDMEVSDYFKEFIRFYNKCYNEGLIDPEDFISKNEQQFTRRRNGEYAVMTWKELEGAVEVGNQRGYGWRFWAVGYPWDFTLPNNYLQYQQFKQGAIFFTKSIKEGDLAKVCGWVDWYMSTESDELAYWGLPTWYTGTGKARRYKPEYKELENWAVYGIAGQKDGIYYGLNNSFALQADPTKTGNLTIKPFHFFDIYWTYEEAPYFVYARDPKLVAKEPMHSVSLNVVRAYEAANVTVVPQVGWEEANFTAHKSWISYQEQLKPKDIWGLLARACTGSVADFDKNWAAYMQAHKDAGVDQAVSDTKKILTDIWYNKIVPLIPKDFVPGK